MADKALVVGSRWPEARTSAAATHILQVIEALKEEDWVVAMTADERPIGSLGELQAQGILCQRLAPNDGGFDDFIKDFRPDLVIFDRFVTEEKFSWRVRLHCPDALRILNTIDLHGLRSGREKLWRATGCFTQDPFEAWQTDLPTSLREMAAIYRSDLSLILSEAEFQLLVASASLPVALLCRHSLGYPEGETGPSFEERQDFGMIGTFRHPPNEDAIVWMKQEIWPLIRQQLPHASLKIWGAHMLQKHKQWHDPSQGFLVLGPVAEHLSALKQLRVNLAPLRFGAGIKGKILDAWSVGTPCVSTVIGAEGLCQASEFGGIIANEPAAVAKAAVELYRNNELWQRHSAQGLAILQKYFRRSETNQAFVKEIAKLRLEVEARRRKNFVGSMLWDQGLRATEYFSRWLELKKSIAVKPE